MVSEASDEKRQDTHLFGSRNEIGYLQPASPVPGKNMNTLHQVLQGNRVILALDQDHSVADYQS